MAGAGDRGLLEAAGAAGPWGPVKMEVAGALETDTSVVQRTGKGLTGATRGQGWLELPGGQRGGAGSRRDRLGLCDLREAAGTRMLVLASAPPLFWPHLSPLSPYSQVDMGESGPHVSP